jgi:OOP family OmpA-OmpF porin
MRSTLKLALALSVATLSTCVWAGAETNSWYTGAKVVGVAPDDNRQADLGLGGQLSLGYVMTPEWDIELNGISSKHKLNGNNLSLNGAGIDLNRVFNRDNAVTPFIGLGFGYMGTSSRANNDGGATAALGVGLIGDLMTLESGNKLQWRADAKWRYLAVNGKGGNWVDTIAGLGLQLSFGGSRPVVAAPAAAPAPAPAPVAAPAPRPVVVAPPPPPADDDQDGVLNNVDRCPTTPRGDKVDAQGCSLRARLKVFFAHDSAKLMPESYADLDVLVSFLKDAPAATGIFEGHTDSNGSDAHNQGLSQRRADSVKKYVVGKGIDAGRVSTKGYGESQPEADNASAEGRAQNRRVIFQRTDVK